MKNIYLMALSVIVFGSCREQIDLDITNSDKHAFVVEGYVTEGELESKVKVSLTTSYLNDGENPLPTNVAYVLIKKTSVDKVIYIDTLKEKMINSGEYFVNLSSMPTTGDKYQLEIKYNNEVFRAESEIKKKAVIDTIFYHFEKEKAFLPKGYYIDFVCRDLKGRDDYYIFEKYKNGQFYFESINDKLNIWDDLITDGLVFPKPILFGINPQPNEDKPGYDKNREFPYTIGDTITIKVLSIDENTYRFYQDLAGQASSASGGALGPLFAPPSDNVRTNIYNIDKNGSKVVGLFSARGSVSAGVRIK